MPTIKDFVERLERDYLPSENEGMWRKTWVIPADKSISGNKTYLTERPNASPLEITTQIPRTKGGHDIGRGHRYQGRRVRGTISDVD